MQPSSTHGATPSVSNRLITLLQTDDDQPVSQHDEFDQLIATEGLHIARFTFFRDLDIALFVLSDRRVISRRLSRYPVLQNAADQQLTDYSVSVTGIHWPQIDADLSLRGFLMEEAAVSVQIQRAFFTA